MPYTTPPRRLRRPGRGLFVQSGLRVRVLSGAWPAPGGASAGCGRSRRAQAWGGAAAWRPGLAASHAALCAPARTTLRETESGAHPRGTLLLPPKRLPFLEKEGRKNFSPPAGGGVPAQQAGWLEPPRGGLPAAGGVVGASQRRPACSRRGGGSLPEEVCLQQAGWWERVRTTASPAVLPLLRTEGKIRCP